MSLFAGTGLTVTTDSEGSIFTMSGIDLSSQTYTDAHSANITTATDASAALTAVKQAITQLATDRASVGANVASLTMYGDQLGVLKDNLSSANSNIKDVDVASESTQYARYNILVQSGVAMLAQANSMPQYMLKLLNQ